MSEWIVRARGLPFSASTDEVTSFFAMCRIEGGKDGIKFVFLREGRPSGEAFIELESEADFNKALEKNNDHMGHRYIEVFKATRNEMTWVLERQGPAGGEVGTEGVLRCRGLPYGTSEAQVVEFFEGFEISEGGVTIPPDAMGRPGGEAYVQFASQEIATEAMGKDREKMGHRYIEIFKSSDSELRAAQNGGTKPLMPRGGMRGAGRPTPYDRGDRFMGGGYGGRQLPMKGPRGGGMGGYGMGGYDGGYGGFGSYGGGSTGPTGMGFTSTTGHSVHMRGLPFRATENDVLTFFAPLVPSAIHIHFEPSGRATGEADVEFESHADATEAMKKDKQHMEHRYVELFLQSEPEHGQTYDPSYDVYETPSGGGGGGPMPLMGKPISAPSRGGYGAGARGGAAVGNGGYPDLDASYGAFRGSRGGPRGAGAGAYGAYGAGAGGYGGAAGGYGGGYGGMSAGGGKMMGRGGRGAGASAYGGMGAVDYGADDYGGGDYGW